MKSLYLVCGGTVHTKSLSSIKTSILKGEVCRCRTAAVQLNYDGYNGFTNSGTASSEASIGRRCAKEHTELTDSKEVDHAAGEV